VLTLLLRDQLVLLVLLVLLVRLVLLVPQAQQQHLQQVPLLLLQVPQPQLTGYFVSDKRFQEQHILHCLQLFQQLTVRVTVQQPSTCLTFVVVSLQVKTTWVARLPTD
jgi:hypothetical protein